MAIVGEPGTARLAVPDSGVTGAETGAETGARGIPSDFSCSAAIVPSVFLYSMASSTVARSASSPLAERHPPDGSGGMQMGQLDLRGLGCGIGGDGIARHIGKGAARHHRLDRVGLGAVAFDAHEDRAPLGLIACKQERVMQDNAMQCSILAENGRRLCALPSGWAGCGAEVLLRGILRFVSGQPAPSRLWTATLRGPNHIGMMWDEDLDAIGLLCPLPVLKARKRLAPMAEGAVLRLVATDPAAQIDVPHFCAEAGHELIGTQEMGEATVYLIRKGGAAA